MPLVGVMCACVCRKTAEVDLGVASAGMACSRNSERESWGFLGAQSCSAPCASSSNTRAIRRVRLGAALSESCAFTSIDPCR